MRGSYLPYLLGVVLVSLSCDPGNYDLQSCKPDATDLSGDACNALNTANMDCHSIYQCDRATSSCKLGPRDFDRDGDPDKLCGGSDCDDHNATVSGINKLCGCTNGKVGTTCTDGVGACLTTSSYVCRGGEIACPDPNQPPVADPDYMSMPAKNGSWDWDCDGKTVMKCADKNGALADCPTYTCTGTTFTAAKTQSQSELTTACSSYCSQYNGSTLGGINASCAQDKIFACDHTCGQPVYYCTCAVGAALDHPCVGTAMPASSVVRCK